MVPPRQHARRRFAVARGDEQFVGPDVVLGLAHERNTEHLEHRAIELLARGKIGNHKLDVINQPAPMEFLRFHAYRSCFPANEHAPA